MTSSEIEYIAPKLNESLKLMNKDLLIVNNVCK